MFHLHMFVSTLLTVNYHAKCGKGSLAQHVNNGFFTNAVDQILGLKSLVKGIGIVILIFAILGAMTVWRQVLVGILIAIIVLSIALAIWPGAYSALFGGGGC